MAIILKNCTANVKGEQRLASHLDSITDDSTILCFNIDFLPAVREIDLFLLNEKLGAFIIEVKAITFDAIQSIAPDKWIISGRGVTQNPLLQAYDQFDGFRNYWQTHKRTKLPRICVTACFPEISRAEWASRFPEGSYPYLLIPGLIFKEDLIDANILFERLAYAMAHPPIRLGFQPTPLQKNFLKDLEDLFLSVKPNELSQNDRQRLIAIEKGVNAAVRAEFPINESTYAIFTGHPGTGKTFRLLSIALSHVFEGKNVLFICFNKTLASEVRRLLDFSEKLELAKGQLKIFDIFHLTLVDQDINCVRLNSFPNPDAWGKAVVTRFKETKRQRTLQMETYDTILVDESHDMMDWHFEIIDFHTTDTTNVCAAVGRGQELYRSESTVENWVESKAHGVPIIKKQLRRNFRNTPMQYFAALAFHKAWPLNLQEVSKAYSMVASTKGRRDEFDFDRQGSSLKYITLPALQGEFDNQSQDQNILVSQEYAKIIKNEIEQIKIDNFAKLVGLLILVPAEKSQQTNCARLALESICQSDRSVSYIDYTIEKARRGSALSGQIRLCTFHSSRGLEGDRIIIFGLENIQKVALQAQAKPENLGFIALSRGVYETSVVARSYFSNNVHSILKEIVTIDDLHKS